MSGYVLANHYCKRDHARPVGLFVNHRRHECGCQTCFDLGAWHSVLVVACPVHAAVSR